MKRIFGLTFLIAWVIGELPRLVWKWPVTLLDSAATLCVVSLLATKNMRLPRPVIAGLAMTLGGSWILALRMFSPREAFPGLLYLVRTCLYICLIANAPVFLRSVRNFVPLALFTFVALGLFQYLFIPDTRFLLRYGWDEHYYRLIGTVLDPNYAGAMFGMIGLYALNRFFVTRRRSFAVLGIAGAVSLVLTFSRASWIATGIALVAYFIMPIKGRWAPGPRLPRFFRSLAMTFIFVFALSLFFAPKPGGEGVNLLRTSSIVQRMESWQQAMTIWRLHPFVGVGFNNYRVASEKLGFPIDPTNHAANSPDSSWLLLLATTGIVGLLSIGVLSISNLKMYYNRSGRTQYNTFYSSLAVLLTIHALFTNTLFFPPILGLIAIMAAS